jgi:hypothetical protein
VRRHWIRHESKWKRRKRRERRREQRVVFSIPFLQPLCYLSIAFTLNTSQLPLFSPVASSFVSGRLRRSFFATSDILIWRPPGCHDC